MPRVSHETIEKLNEFINLLAGDARSKCALCTETLTHIVKTAEAQTGAGTATVTRALAEKINETAAPGDRVSGGALQDRVRVSEQGRRPSQKEKMAQCQNKPEPETPYIAFGEKEILDTAKKIRSVDRDRKKDELEEKKAKIAAQIKEKPDAPKIWCESYETWIPNQPDCDLLLTDPPYSTDVEDIAKFAAEWLPVALSKVKPTGRAYIFIGAYPEEIQAYLSVKAPTQILVWAYRNTLGPSPKKDYKLNWQAILYYRMPDAPDLDCGVMLEQFSVQDISAPDGRQMNRYHAWQKPNEIAERFVRHSTQPGDIVLDPFCCTGTFPLAAAKLGRVGLGCDIDPENLKIAEGRGCKLM